MKKVLLSVLLLGLLALAVFWLRPGAGPGFKTPEECVEAWCRAIKTTDEAAYLKCLAERPRAATVAHFSTPGALANDLRARGSDLRNWVVLAPETVGADRVAVQVDQQFSTSRKRQKLILERVGASWCIAELQAPQDQSQVIPFGTHVSQVPEDQPARDPENEK